MKKQYRISNNVGFKKYVYLYHDGELVDTLSVWEGDDLETLREYIERNRGYTFGYTKKEVEKAKIKYEKMLHNIIKEEEA